MSTWNVEVGGAGGDLGPGDELVDAAVAIHEGRTPPAPWSLITTSGDGTMVAVGGEVDGEVYCQVATFDSNGRVVEASGGSGAVSRPPAHICVGVGSENQWALVHVDDQVATVVDRTGTTRTVKAGHTGVLVAWGGEAVAFDAAGGELGRVDLDR